MDFFLNDKDSNDTGTYLVKYFYEMNIVSTGELGDPPPPLYWGNQVLPHFGHQNVKLAPLESPECGLSNGANVLNYNLNYNF